MNIHEYVADAIEKQNVRKLSYAYKITGNNEELKKKYLDELPQSVLQDFQTYSKAVDFLHDDVGVGIALCLEMVDLWLRTKDYFEADISYFKSKRKREKVKCANLIIDGHQVDIRIMTKRPDGFDQMEAHYNYTRPKRITSKVNE